MSSHFDETRRLRATVQGLEAMLDDATAGLLRVRDEADDFTEAKSAAEEALREIGEAGADLEPES